jgi:hypothetical protein
MIRDRVYIGIHEEHILQYQKEKERLENEMKKPDEKLPSGAEYKIEKIGKSYIRKVTYPKCVKCGSTNNNDRHWCFRCFSEWENPKKTNECLITDDD